VNLVLRSLLEEMYSAEQLWAVHSGVSTTYSSSYSTKSNR
jgi:hypothetical protein